MTKAIADDLAHGGDIGLTITSAGYVEVESVKFTGAPTGATIGIGATAERHRSRHHRARA